MDTLKGWPTPSLTRPRLIDSGGCTRPGALNGKALKSQDRYVTHCRFPDTLLTDVCDNRALVGWAGDIFVAAVFDGHGLGGEVASEACVECLERAVGNPFLQVRFGKVKTTLACSRQVTLLLAGINCVRFHHSARANCITIVTLGTVSSNGRALLDVGRCCKESPCKRTSCC